MTDEELMESLARIRCNTYWKSIVDTKYEGIVCSVYPIKQEDVNNLMNRLYKRDCPVIKAVYVFGSSISYRCTFESDLDVAVELVEYTDENRKIAYDYIMESNIEDIDLTIVNNYTSKEFIREAVTKGLCIYHKDVFI